MGEWADKEVVDDLSLQTVLGGHGSYTREVVLAWDRGAGRGRGGGGGAGGEGREGVQLIGKQGSPRWLLSSRGAACILTKHHYEQEEELFSLSS